MKAKRVITVAERKARAMRLKHQAEIAGRKREEERKDKDK